MKFKSIFLLLGLVFGILASTDCFAQKAGAKDKVNAPVNPALQSKPKIAYSGPVLGDPATNESYKSPNLDFVLTAKKADLCNNKNADNSIRKGSDPFRSFQIKNIGSEPLIIKKAKPSCGCVVVNYPQSPIMPGETAVLDVRYDTNRIGPFTKSITVETNANEPSTIFRISGVVSDCQ